MHTLGKLPNNPQIWREYIDSNLVYEQCLADSGIVHMNLNDWYTCEGEICLDDEDTKRFLWTSAYFKYGVLLED